MVETSYEKYKEDIKRELETEEKKKKSIFARISPTHQILIVAVIVFLAYLYFTSGESCPSGSYYLEQKNLCFYCTEGILDSKTLKCMSDIPENQTCSYGLTINTVENICEGFALTSIPKKSFNLNTLLIIGGIIVFLIILFQKITPSEMRELSNEELLTYLEKEIHRMQNTPFLRESYQLNSNWRIFPTGEFDIPHKVIHELFGEDYIIKTLKYFPLNCVDPFKGELQRTLIAGIDISTGDLKILRFVGTDTTIPIHIRDVFQQPSPDTKAEIWKEKFRKGMGVEAR